MIDDDVLDDLLDDRVGGPWPCWCCEMNDGMMQHDGYYPDGRRYLYYDDEAGVGEAGRLQSPLRSRREVMASASVHHHMQFRSIHVD